MWFWGIVGIGRGDWYWLSVEYESWGRLDGGRLRLGGKCLVFGGDRLGLAWGSSDLGRNLGGFRKSRLGLGLGYPGLGWHRLGLDFSLFSGGSLRVSFFAGGSLQFSLLTNSIGLSFLLSRIIRISLFSGSQFLSLLQGKIVCSLFSGSQFLRFFLSRSINRSLTSGLSISFFLSGVV